MSFIKVFRNYSAGSNKPQIFDVSFEQLPKNLEELKTMRQAALSWPHETAALTILALARYPQSSKEAMEMLNYLRGPQPMNIHQRRFLKDSFAKQDFIIRSYFHGSTKENGYTPVHPYALTIREDECSYDRIADGFVTLYVNSSGTKGTRMIKLRIKDSTGQWFLWEHNLLHPIEEPIESDEWK